MRPDELVKKILQSRVYEITSETPTQLAPNLSTHLGHSVYLKREDLHPVFSFKIRGAYNKMVGLSEADQKKGVVAASAGNHAQGVALSAKKLGISATIVMPKTSPPIKVQSVRRLGGKAVLYGDTYDDAYGHAQDLIKKSGSVFIHPYDDVEVMAGQGTAGVELFRQRSAPIDAVFIPVGGGGLAAGIAAYIKSVSPKTKIIGVEPEDAASLTTSLKLGRRVKLDQVGIFADGVAVKQIGKFPFKILQSCVDQMLTVSTDEICGAIKDIFDEIRIVPEPAGAVALAGLKQFVRTTQALGQTYVAILSGANVNFDRLRHISERAEIGEEREALFAVKIPEKPGSFKRFCKTIGHRSVTEFNYRYADEKAATIFLGIELGGESDERNRIHQKIKNAGYEVVDLTDDEMAKLHVRHMVGGRRGEHRPEQLFRFQFPERPGALIQFLNGLGAKWNISLFHYRNHGAAFGRVLVGLEIPKSEQADFKAFLKNLGYRYYDESGNLAYDLFLS